MSRIMLVRLVIALTLFIVLAGAGLLFNHYDKFRVVRVIDGDTFVIRDGARVRLLGVDAPEQDRCFATPSAEYLRGLVLNKRVALRNTMTDTYGRTLANVFVDGHFVNETMVVTGAARNTRSDAVYGRLLSESEFAAKEHGLGIWSFDCRQYNAASGSACMIKGNDRNGTRVYHLPGCPNYADTIIDLSFGDRWFCSERDASAAGFARASGCP